MKIKSSKRACSTLVWVITLSIVMAQPVLGQDELHPNQISAEDTVRIYPKKLPTHSTWEKIVSFPGSVAYFPFRLFFGGVGATVKFVQEAPSMEPLREAFVPKIRIWGVLPAFSKRSGVGLKYYRNDIWGKGSKLTINAKHGILDRRQKHYIRLRDVPMGTNFFSFMLVEYRYLTTESFFGIGPKSDYDDRSSYSLEKTTAEARFGLKLGSTANLQAFANYRHANVFGGERDDVPSLTEVPGDSLPGLDTGIKMGTFGIELNIDTRDNRAITRTGWEVNVRSGIANQVDGDEFKYWNIQADIRRHIHMFYDRRLILRLAAERVRPLSGKDIPFFDLSELGRRETIRGFPRGRFRDRDMLMASIEYRYPIWHYFDWILFVDGGQVSPDILNDVDLNDFSFTYGSGFLIRGNEDPVLQISVGVSKDQVRFYVVLD